MESFLRSFDGFDTDTFLLPRTQNPHNNFFQVTRQKNRNFPIKIKFLLRLATSHN